MIVNDQGPLGAVVRPDATVGFGLGHAEAAQEDIEAGLPDTAGVAAARHLPGDE
jgi:hypothetical protein